MSSVRVLVGTARVPHPLCRWKTGQVESGWASFAGWVLIEGFGCRYQSNLRVSEQRLVRTSDSAVQRWWQVLAEASRAESPLPSSQVSQWEQATSLSSKGKLALICGTTARHIHGNSKDLASLTDVDVVFAGAEDTTVKSNDGASSLEGTTGLRAERGSDKVRVEVS